jgi:hypothetical protein
VRRALAGKLHVRDGVVEFPAQAGMQIADGHGRGAADARGAMDVDCMAFDEQLVQFSDAAVELGPQFDLFLDHGNTAKKENGARPIVSLQGRPIEVDRAHVVVSVDIEHGSDAGFAAEPFDVVNASGMGSDKEARKDLRVGECFAWESTHFSLRFQVSTKSGGPLAVCGGAR